MFLDKMALETALTQVQNLRKDREALLRIQGTGYVCLNTQDIQRIKNLLESTKTYEH